MVEACGPVHTAEGAEHYVGAVRATNNTAEMQALIEALFWLNSCVEHDDFPIFQQSDGDIIDETFCGEGEQSAGNAALSHAEK